MGKQGPCRHCGTTCTPLWRNGPPAKPVLCNACGSRWRTRGTLANYTPLHSRTFERIHRYDLYPKSFGIDTSNGSSSSSAISCSQSRVQLGRMDGNKISGPVKSSFWDFPIPTKKRSKTRSHSPSTVEKLRRNLADILREQESSYLTENSEDVLIFKKEDPLLFPEIGLGAILLKPSLSFTGEESEASSLIMEDNVSCLNNGDVESSCLTLRSQSSEYSTSRESNGLIQETGYAEESKVNVAKQSAITNKYSGTTLLGNPDILQNTDSPPWQIIWEPGNDESFTIMNNMAKTTSCLSHHIGDGISLHAETNPNLPYLPTSGGPSFDTIGGFEVPNQQMVGHNPPSSMSIPAFSTGRSSSVVPLQMVGHNPPSSMSMPAISIGRSSSEVPLQIGGHNPPSSTSMLAFSTGRSSSAVPLQMGGHNPPSSMSMPAFSTGRSSSVVPLQMGGHNPPSSMSMPAFSTGSNFTIPSFTNIQVATYYNDLLMRYNDVQMRVHPGNSFPIVRLHSISALQNGVNDEETRSADEQPNNRNIFIPTCSGI